MTSHVPVIVYVKSRPGNCVTNHVTVYVKSRPGNCVTNHVTVYDKSRLDNCVTHHVPARWPRLLLTRRVSLPPTMERPRPIFSLTISMVVSFPGVMAALRGFCEEGARSIKILEGDSSMLACYGGAYIIIIFEASV